MLRRKKQTFAPRIMDTDTGRWFEVSAPIQIRNMSDVELNYDGCRRIAEQQGVITREGVEAPDPTDRKAV